jgi:hypothetical protein
MTKETERRLIDSYLDRLEGAAHVLAPERRTELLAEIRDHIENSRLADGIDSEAGLRALLDRMGRPEEIVAASATADEVPGGFAPSAPVAAPIAGPHPSLALEIGAVVMLTAGSLLPLLGWLVGVVLLWSSDRWRVREKLLGTLLVPGGIGGLLVLGTVFATTSSCFTTYDPSGKVVEDTCNDSHFGSDVVQPTVVALLLLAALLVPLILLHRVRRRAAAETRAAQPGRLPQPIG